jgi:hypothetical protein
LFSDGAHWLTVSRFPSSWGTRIGISVGTSQSPHHFTTDLTHAGTIAYFNTGVAQVGAVVTIALAVFTTGANIARHTHAANSAIRNRHTEITAAVAAHIRAVIARVKIAALGRTNQFFLRRADVLKVALNVVCTGLILG